MPVLFAYSNKMRPISRREALQIGGVALTTSFAGCASVLGQSGVTLDAIRVVNKREESHTVHLIVEHDGEIAYWSSFDFPPATTRGDDVIEVDSVTVENEWPDRPGRLVIHARLDGQSSWETLSLHEQGSGCHLVQVDVERTDQPPADVVLFSSPDCRN